MHRTVILCLLLVCFKANAQTRIAPPAAKINLAELGQMDKAKVKKMKKWDRFKEEKARLLSKQLKRHTDFSREEIDGYSNMVKGLDSLKMVTFEQSLEKVIANQNQAYAGKYKHVKKEKEKAQKWKAHSEKYRRDSVSFTDINSYRQSFTKATFSYVKDSAQQFTAEKLQYGVGIDSAYKLTVDSTDIIGELTKRSKVKIDSSYLDYTLSGYDSLHLSTLEEDSLLYASLQNNVETFMQKFAQERIAAQDLGLPNPENNQLPSVQHFIPELEKFDYVKPKIPNEELTKALIEQEKEKKKQRLKDAALPKLKNGETEREVNWIDRWKIGGFVEYRPENNLIELTPTVAYGIMDKVSIGVGYSTVILLDNRSNIDQQNAYRTYLDYLLVNSFFIHVESEWKAQKQPEAATIKERSTLLGLGRNFSYKSVSTSILSLYNLSAPNAIDTRRFSVRFAINFNP